MKLTEREAMKNNRIFTIILVVIIGVLIGLAILSNQTKSPFMKVIYDQQISLLKGQQQLNDKMDKLSKEKKEDAGKLNLQDLLAQQKLLENRITKLEAQIKAGNAGGTKPSAPTRPPEDFSTVYEIPVDHSPVMGNKNAPVTLVEFIDFQCPYCARFHSPLIEAAKAFPGKVNYIIKNFPLSFHPEARNAAKAAFAAGEQGKYAEMVDIILQNNKQLGKDTYVDLAGRIGLNVDKFKKDLIEKDAQFNAYIQKDIDLGNKVHVRGTPTMFINGRKTRARDLNSFKKEIEAILNK